MFTSQINPFRLRFLPDKIKSFFLLFTLSILTFSISCCGSAGSDLFKDILLSLTGDPVIVPDSDSSPPLVKLIVPYMGPGGSNVTITNTPKTIKLTKQLIDDGFQVIAVTEDQQGAKSIKIPFHDVTVNCASGNVGQIQNYLLDGPGLTSSGNIGDTASTKIWISYFVYLGGYKCNPGYNFKSISISFNADGTNFQNTKVSTANVTFVYP